MGRIPDMIESLTWRPVARVDRYDEAQTRRLTRHLGRAPTGADFTAAGMVPYAIDLAPGNLITTAGLTRLFGVLAGTGQALTNAATRLGVGNGTGTAAVGDSNLSASSGSSNRWFQVMDATYPAASGAVLTLRSTFGTSDGNFNWNEWGIDVGTPPVTSSATVGGLLFNHRTGVGFGIKSSGTTWVFTVTVGGS